MRFAVQTTPTAYWQRKFEAHATTFISERKGVSGNVAAALRTLCTLHDGMSSGARGPTWSRLKQNFWRIKLTKQIQTHCAVHLFRRDLFPFIASLFHRWIAFPLHDLSQVLLFCWRSTLKIDDRDTFVCVARRYFVTRRVPTHLVDAGTLRPPAVVGFHQVAGLHAVQQQFVVKRTRR